MTGSDHQITSRYQAWLLTTLDTFKVGEEELGSEDAALRFSASVLADLSKMSSELDRLGDRLASDLKGKLM